MKSTTEPIMKLRCGAQIPSLNPTIAVASIGATSQLLFTIALGAIAASRPNVLDGNAVKSLSRLAYNVFQPAFLLCSVANTIANGSGSSIDGNGNGNVGITKKALLIMPIIALLQITIGSFFSKLVVHMTNLSGDERSDARVCMTFVNSATLPFIFAAALFKENNNGLMMDVSSCLSFYLLAWSPAFWTYGRHLLLSHDRHDSHDSYGSSSSGGNIIRSNGHSHGGSGRLSNVNQALQKLFSPPVIGSTIGIIIGSIPFLRSLFLNNGILSPLFGATKTLGSAYLPAALLVLSGSLVGGSAAKTENQLQSKTISTSLPIRTLISIAFTRFLLSPIVAYLTLIFLSRYTVNILPPPNTKARAVISFIILMEGCMPPAQNSVLILQLAGYKERAERMAKLLTLIYVLSIIPITLLMSAALQFSNIMAF